MDKFTHENFYLINAVIAFISFGAILGNCYKSTRAINKKSKELREGLEESQRERLTFDSGNVKARVREIRRRMGYKED